MTGAMVKERLMDFAESVIPKFRNIPERDFELITQSAKQIDKSIPFLAQKY
jgi:hypothetical protein